MTELIAQVVKEITGADQILLFGSRVHGNERSDSDYDVLVVLSDSVGQKERLRLASRCRRRLAQAGVDADVLVKSPEDIHDYGDKRGSIVYEALTTGVPL
jgi:predicted nucleotidyltransferase